MSFTAILSGLVAFFKAVPVLADYVDKFFNAWVTSQISEKERELSNIKYERRALMSAISKAGNDEERKALSITLSRLSGL